MFCGGLINRTQNWLNPYLKIFIILNCTALDGSETPSQITFCVYSKKVWTIHELTYTHNRTFNSKFYIGTVRFCVAESVMTFGRIGVFGVLWKKPLKPETESKESLKRRTLMESQFAGSITLRVMLPQSTLRHLCRL